MKKYNSLILLLSLALLPITYVNANENSALSSLQFLTDAIPQTAIPPVTDFKLLSDEVEVKSAPEMTGEELFQYLHEYVQPAQGYSIHGYGEAKSYMYSTADNSGCNGKPGIITFYSRICANGSSGNGGDYKEIGDQNKDGVVDTYINAEHLWPQSFFAKQLPMVSDLHHLQPTFGTPNSRRSNYKFGIVKSYSKYSTSSGCKLGDKMFEPTDEVKGNVARAILYFVTRYYDKDIRQKSNYTDFWKRNVKMFLEWNKMDPPDTLEQRRNELIMKFQGNRNPYVDDYTLPDKIGEQVFASH